jgi:hypothetical protein
MSWLISKIHKTLILFSLIVEVARELCARIVVADTTTPQLLICIALA